MLEWIERDTTFSSHLINRDIGVNHPQTVPLEPKHIIARQPGGVCLEGMKCWLVGPQEPRWTSQKHRDK